MNLSAAARSGVPRETSHYNEEIGRARASGWRIAARCWRRGRTRHASAEVKRIAAGHLEAIDAKLAALRAVRETLASLVERCTHDDRPEYPILRSLEV